MAEKKEKKKVEGLWIPNHIENIPRSVLDHLGKKVLAHIYSFGEKGCYQSNETMAKMFWVSARTISRRITAIRKADLVYVKSPKGYYRTLWAKSHPDVKAAVKLWYRNREIAKSSLESGQKIAGRLRQDCPIDLDKSGEATATNGVFRLGQDCLTTNTETYKETNKKTKAVDLPLPAGGQASQLLEDRKADMITQVEQLKRSFGRCGRQWTPELTPEERDRRKQEQIKALLAGQSGQKDRAEKK